MAIKQRPTRDQPRKQDEVKEDLARPRADESKRLNVPVPPDLYKAMKRQSVEEERSISEITRALWQEYLDRSE